MNTGTVIGKLWSTRRLQEVPTGAFLKVELDDANERIVAFDVLGSGVGERVLITRGAAAVAWFGDTRPPIDALIIGSVDPTDHDNKKEN
jgi:ethanolamine utilization protein EutN